MTGCATIQRARLVETGERFFLGDTVGVAVLAFNKVDVVLAVFVFEGGVHFFDVEAAIGETRVTGGAGGASLHAMLGVAREATESFVDADGSAIVARTNLRCGFRGMTLIAEGLALIGADFNGAVFVEHPGQRQFRDGNLTHFTAIEETE